MAKAKSTRGARKNKKTVHGMIDFSYGNIEYQIDTNRRKVYRRFIEVETSKTSLIMGAFSNSLAPAAAK